MIVTSAISSSARSHFRHKKKRARFHAPTTYTHDNQGLRLRKHGTLSAAGDTGTLAFVYDHSPNAGGLPSSYPHLLGEYNASGQPVREYIWLGEIPVAIAMADPANPLGQPKLYTIHTDHLNTPQVVMDRSTAAMRWRWMTEPFGTTQPEESINGTAAFTQPLRFPGQYADGETGMAYNVMRSYIPGVGRYSQSDPIGLLGGINTYGYVGGNPLSAVDPEGLAACLVNFPDMPIDTGYGFSMDLGHSGILTYDSRGATQYHEYGRYKPEVASGARLPEKDGNVRRMSVPDLALSKDGRPTQASMDILRRTLSEKAGKGTPANLTCDSDADEQKIREYITSIAEDAKRKKYSWNPLRPNQCHSFASGAFRFGRP